MRVRAGRFVAAALLGSCAAACGSTDVTIQIKSDPEGATVYIDGEREGTAGNTFALHYGDDPRRKIYIQLCGVSQREPADAMWELVEVPSPNAQGVREKVFKLEKLR